MSNLENMSQKNCSKIIGIQFSILSPDEIRKGSVAEITSRDTYVNNKPVIGGLFDPRMGVLESGLICPTDGLDYMKIGFKNIFPEKTEIELNISEQELYDDWNHGINKYGLIKK
jgi:DNA-directed RNA polymerase beta' subunit